MANFPVKDDEIKALRIKILKALGVSQYPAQSIGSVASNNNLMVGDVKALVEGYGWPDPKAMASAAKELAAGQDPATPVSPQELAARRTATLKETTAAPVVRRADAAPPSSQVGFTVDGLLGVGEKSEKARTRRLATKIREQVAELRGLVNTEAAEREAAEKAAAEKERLRAEVEQLEAQLAEKKAQLSGKKKLAASRDRNGDAKQIREWAAAHSVDCPAFGRIPGDVREAYELAQDRA